MAQTTIHTCDICKQSKSVNDLAHLHIKSEGINIKDVTAYKSLDIDICSDCLKKKGFVIEAKTDEEKQQAGAKNKLTLEDKIYEILDDLGVVFQE